MKSLILLASLAAVPLIFMQGITHQPDARKAISGNTLLPAATEQASPVSADWPDWRGTHRDGTWQESGVMDVFLPEPLPVRWSVPVGSGYSGPTVSQGKVYVTDRQEQPVETEGVICIDELSGSKIWEYRYPCEYQGIGYPAGPRASVVLSGGKAYSLGAMGHLHCFDAANGGVVWKRDLNSEYAINMPIWGIAATPLVDDQYVYLQISGSDNACVVALDKHTGKEIWRNLDDKASYSAPVMIEKYGRKVLVVWTEDHLAGLDPGTGKLHWKIPWKLKMGMGIATPVWYDDHIFVSAFYDGSMLVRLSNSNLSAEVVWKRAGESERKTDALHCVMNTPVILDRLIYGVDSYGELRCLDFNTGDRIWENLTAVKKDRWANIHFIQNGPRTWMFNEHGELIIAEMSRNGYREISRTKIIDTTTPQLPRGVTWSHPAFANQHVFARNDHEMRCISLKK